ncbi:hypothetical protein [Vibrio sp. HN007]|uniref:hypothetical protein n=1 Tax=Vibrio iocasae TaxID=3098914 RepID=UPI0035D422C3
MIVDGQAFSLLCRHIHSVLNSNKVEIELSNVSDATAKAFGHRTLTLLLENLPLEFDDTFPNTLNNVFLETYKIATHFSLANFPFPERFHLSKEERSLVWKAIVSDLQTEANKDSFASIISLFGKDQTIDALLEEPIPKGLTPSGEGTWLSASQTNLSRYINSITVEPSILFSESDTTDRIAQRVGQNIKDMCFSYWDKYNSLHIKKVAGELCKKPLMIKRGAKIDISFLASFLFSDVVKHLSNIFLGKPCPPNNMARSEELVHSLTDNLYGELIQNIQGHCILNEMILSSKEYDTLIWSELDSVKPCIEDFSKAKYEFYEKFFWSKAFTKELQTLAEQWLKMHEDWTKTLWDLTFVPYEPPQLFSDKWFIKEQSEFSRHYQSPDNLHVFITPYSRQDDRLGYHNILINVEDEAVNDFVNFDECRLRNKLEEAVRCGELNFKQLEAIIEDAREEAEEEAEEYFQSLPFIIPFTMEYLTVERVNSHSRTEFVIHGTSISNLNDLSVLGTHAQLMYSISSELHELSTYAQNNDEMFSGVYGHVLYITDMYLSNMATTETLALELERALRMAGNDIHDYTIIINADSLSRYFNGAPYKGCEVMEREYNDFIRELLNVFSERCLNSHFFSISVCEN